MKAPWSPSRIALVCALAAAAGGCAAPGNRTAVVRYTGAIDAEQNRRFFAGVDARAVERLIITSSGGEVDAAIALGRWVFANALDVEVSEYCLSSCANYIFPAGRRKIIREGAVVAWHGNYHHLKATGLWRDDVVRRMERHGDAAATAERRVRRQVQRLVRMERQFFQRIGVDQYVCWVGKMPPYEAPNYYFLSKDDMARFGITNVRVPPDYEHTDTSGLGVAIDYIDLRD